MLRFVRPNGQPFDLDYTGTIYCVDAGNDLVAVCDGGKTWSEAAEDAGIIESAEDGHSFTIDSQIDLEDLFAVKGTCGRPDNWDDWRLVIKVSDSMSSVIRRAIVSAWAATSFVQRLLVEISAP